VQVLASMPVNKRRSNANAIGVYADAHFNSDVALSTCPASASWRALRTALDINNTMVIVYQPDEAVAMDRIADEDRTLDDNGDNTVVEVQTGEKSTAAGTPSARGGKGRGRIPSTQQLFYTVTCRNDFMTSKRSCTGCCIGIDHVRYSYGTILLSSYELRLINAFNVVNLSQLTGLLVGPFHALSTLS
jgi:hypothetical protein